VIINAKKEGVVAFAQLQNDGTVNVHVLRPEHVTILNVTLSRPVAEIDIKILNKTLASENI
jgi:hypothetical protein